MTQWQVEPLDKRHDRKNFNCDVESLNDFLHKHARQNALKDISRTYVLTHGNSTQITGYYTLSSGNISFVNLPEEFTKRLPRYPVPAAHLGRLAVDSSLKGKGLGGILLINALHRACHLADQIGIYVVTVHALGEQAKSFYEKYGFIPLLDNTYHLFLPMATIRRL